MHRQLQQHQDKVLERHTECIIGNLLQVGALL